jgi:hypothetical protein
MKTKILSLIVVVSLFVTSCDKEILSSSLITEEEATVSAKLDIMNDDVSKIVEDQLNTTNRFDRVSVAPSSVFVPSCATISKSPQDLSNIVVGDLITVTVDFGTDGCDLPNGNKIKGKLIVSFKYEPNATSRTINYSFDKFYHNDVEITGNKTFVRTMSTATPIHPIIKMNMDMTATFPDGKSYTRTGSRTTEITAGYDTPANYLDNKYSVSGSWTTTFPDAASQYSEITTPLIVDLSCTKFSITEGVIKLTRKNTVATVNYGTGDCDNTAVFTINGIPFNIFVGK